MKNFSVFFNLFSVDMSMPIPVLMIRNTKCHFYSFIFDQIKRFFGGFLQTRTLSLGLHASAFVEFPSQKITKALVENYTHLVVLTILEV